MCDAFTFITTRIVASSLLSFAVLGVAGFLGSPHATSWVAFAATWPLLFLLCLTIPDDRS